MDMTTAIMSAVRMLSSHDASVLPIRLALGWFSLYLYTATSIRRNINRVDIVEADNDRTNSTGPKYPLIQTRIILYKKWPTA